VGRNDRFAVTKGVGERCSHFAARPASAGGDREFTLVCTAARLENVRICRDEVRREPPCAQQVQLKSVRLPALVSQITEPSWPQDVAVSAFVRWLWFTRVCADIVGPSIHEGE
jgi:hypothetical protein